MNGYADDLAAVIEHLDLTDATLAGHSTGGGEVARYWGMEGVSERTLMPDAARVAETRFEDWFS